MNLLLYGWAEVNNPDSLLVALTCNPWIYFFADGYTMGRPAMSPFTQARATNRPLELWLLEERCWYLPHPLQVVDAKGALTWSLLGARRPV